LQISSERRNLILGKEKASKCRHHHKSVKSYFNTAKLFLNHGADVKVQNRDDSVLHCTCFYNIYPETHGIIELMGENNADVNGKYYNETPFD